MTVAERFQTYAVQYDAAIDLVELRVDRENGLTVDQAQVDAAIARIGRECRPLVSFLCAVIAVVAVQGGLDKVVVSVMREEVDDLLADAQAIMRSKGYEL